MGIQAFAVTLEGFEAVFQQPGWLEAFEQAILSHLEPGATLIRWAIVRVEGSRYWCEGAYADALSSMAIDKPAALSSSFNTCKTASSGENPKA